MIDKDLEKGKKIILLGTQMATGGAQKALLTQGEWFFNNGYHVAGIFFYDRDNLSQKYKDTYAYPIYNLKSWDKNSNKLKKTMLLIKGLFHLIKLFKTLKPDVIITYTHHSNLLGIPLAKVAKIPIRIATHRGNILGFTKWQEYLHTQLINSKLTTCLVSNSEYGKDQSILKGVNPVKVYVIRNGVSIPSPNLKAIRDLRKKLIVNNDTKLILSVGRLTHEKGHDLLIEAFHEVVITFPNILLLIAGDGILKNDYINLASKLMIENKVVFLGNTNDVFTYMAASDIFVIPSRSEGMPNALLEAMGIGAPAIGFDVGGIGEIIENWENGMLAIPEDPQSLAITIKLLLTDKYLRKKIADAGKMHIRKEYSFELMCKKYSELIENLENIN